MELKFENDNLTFLLKGSIRCRSVAMKKYKNIKKFLNLNKNYIFKFLAVGRLAAGQARMKT